MCDLRRVQRCAVIPFDAPYLHSHPPQDVSLVMALEPDAPLMLLGRAGSSAGGDPSSPLPFYMPPPPASGKPWDPAVFYETLDFQIGACLWGGGGGPWDLVIFTRRSTSR